MKKYNIWHFRLIYDDKCTVSIYCLIHFSNIDLPVTMGTSVLVSIWSVARTLNIVLQLWLFFLFSFFCRCGKQLFYCPSLWRHTLGTGHPSFVDLSERYAVGSFLRNSGWIMEDIPPLWGRQLKNSSKGYKSFRHNNPPFGHLTGRTIFQMPCHVLRMTCFFLLCLFFLGSKHRDAETACCKMNYSLMFWRICVLFLYLGCCWGQQVTLSLIKYLPVDSKTSRILMDF